MTVRQQSRCTVSKPLPPPRPQRARKIDNGAPQSSESAVCYWPGHSGRLYRFCVFGLIECPAPGQGAFILVRIEKGKRLAMHIGAAASRAATLNLAHIRRRGAQLGAHEVHVLGVTGTTADLRRTVRDLRSSVL